MKFFLLFATCIIQVSCITIEPSFQPSAVELEKIQSKNLDASVSINEGLYKDPSYYNGIYFDCFVPGFGKIIGSGGRYDQVVKHFGLQQQAIGFAIRYQYLESVLNE